MERISALFVTKDKKDEPTTATATAANEPEKRQLASLSLQGNAAGPSGKSNSNGIDNNH